MQISTVLSYRLEPQELLGSAQIPSYRFYSQVFFTHVGHATRLVPHVHKYHLSGIQFGTTVVLLHDGGELHGWKEPLVVCTGVGIHFPTVIMNWFTLNTIHRSWNMQ